MSAEHAQEERDRGETVSEPDLASVLDSGPSSSEDNELTSGSSESIARIAEPRVYRYRHYLASNSQSSFQKIVELPESFYKEIHDLPVNNRKKFLCDELTKAQITALFQSDPILFLEAPVGGQRKQFSLFFSLLVTLNSEDVAELLREYGSQMTGDNFCCFVSEVESFFKFSEIVKFCYAWGFDQIYKTAMTTPFTPTLIYYITESSFVADFINDQSIDHLQNIMRVRAWEFVAALSSKRNVVQIINPWISTGISKIAKAQAGMACFETTQGRETLVYLWKKRASTYLVGFVLAYGNVLQQRGDATGAKQFISLLYELSRHYHALLLKETQSSGPSSSLGAPQIYISKNHVLYLQLAFILSPGQHSTRSEVADDSASVRERLIKIIEERFLVDSHSLYIGPAVEDVKVVTEMRNFIKKNEQLNSFACLAMITYYQCRLKTSQGMLFERLTLLGQYVIGKIFPLERISELRAQLGTLPQNSRLAMARWCGGVDDRQSHRRPAVPISSSSSEQSTEMTSVPPSPQSPPAQRQRKHPFHFLSGCYPKPDDDPVATTSYGSHP